MMHRLAVILGLAALALVAPVTFPAGGATLKLNNGDTIEGEPKYFQPQGLTLKKADGTDLPRVAWTNFSQEALKELSSNPKAKAFVQPLLEAEEAELAEKEKKAAIEIKPKIPDRLDRPDPAAGFGALFSSTITLLGFILIYAGNVYAGYEMGVYRNYPGALTAGVAAIAPVIGPIIFLCVPTRMKKSQDQLASESMAAHLLAQQLAEAAEAGREPTPEEVAAMQAEAEAAAAAAVAAAAPQIITYARGQTTFNRRFFETKFAGFLRLVPGEAEKDKVIYIKSSRGEHVGARLTRIEPNELHLQINKGGATADVMIPFNEIFEVQIRPIGV